MPILLNIVLVVVSAVVCLVFIIGLIIVVTRFQETLYRLKRARRRAIRKPDVAARIHAERLEGVPVLVPELDVIRGEYAGDAPSVIETIDHLNSASRVGLKDIRDIECLLFTERG